MILIKNKIIIYTIILVLLLVNVSLVTASKNGFALDNPLIPKEEIFHGGPPKGGIPSLDIPKVVKANEATFLHEGDRVLALKRNGIAKAYPLRILNWHEIVNDQFDDEGITITWSTLNNNTTH